MKLFLLFFGATASLLLSGCDFADHHNGQSITIKNSDSKYSLNATFNHRKLPKIMTYLEKALDNDKLFSGPRDFKDSDINMGDTLKFHLEVSANELEIKFRKNENSYHAYRRLERTCNGFKQLLR